MGILMTDVKRYSLERADLTKRSKAGFWACIEIIADDSIFEADRSLRESGARDLDRFYIWTNSLAVNEVLKS